MRTTMIRTITLAATLFGATGCATRQEMSTWVEHGTHFASGAHAFFSVRNDMASRQEVTRTDLSRARSEAWWGDPVTVSPDDIVSR
jgi:hypothetical protein